MIGQSKLHSLIEALTNLIVGFVIAIVLNVVVLRAFGFNATWTHAVWYTVIFTVVSFVRGYVLRRLFNRWHLQEAKRTTLTTAPTVPGVMPFEVGAILTIGSDAYVVRKVDGTTCLISRRTWRRFLREIFHA